MQIYDFLAHYWFIGSLERGHGGYGGHSGNTLQKLSGHQTYEVFKTS